MPDGAARKRNRKKICILVTVIVKFSTGGRLLAFVKASASGTHLFHTQARDRGQALTTLRPQLAFLLYLEAFVYAHRAVGSLKAVRGQAKCPCRTPLRQVKLIFVDTDAKTKNIVTLVI